MPDSKNIDNPVGQGGGQRKKLSRAERQDNGPHRNLDRRGAADRKAELVRRMREKTRAAEDTAQPDARTGGRTADAGTDAAADTDAGTAADTGAGTAAGTPES
ncbi:hypothetical protein GCM10010305_46550 [Streptomyces termitum]|uniref:Uncharacterized protein n=1 Tax=Streptomyces termitum TaxID=67368 RepID=A0A918T700_9ACTN|nr:DUF6243 family protein [Streptomyces termitum]GHA97634.1 hypothetical protein GCM10010305_46550 [Streptomyces termitum]